MAIIQLSAYLLHIFFALKLELTKKLALGDDFVEFHPTPSQIPCLTLWVIIDLFRDYFMLLFNLEWLLLISPWKYSSYM